MHARTGPLSRLDTDPDPVPTLVSVRNAESGVVYQLQEKEQRHG